MINYQNHMCTNIVVRLKRDYLNVLEKFAEQGSGLIYMLWKSDVIAPQLRNGWHLAGPVRPRRSGHRAYAGAEKLLRDSKLVMGVARRQHRTRPSSLPPELGRGYSLRCINKTFQPVGMNNSPCFTKHRRHQAVHKRLNAEEILFIHCVC